MSDQGRILVTDGANVYRRRYARVEVAAEIAYTCEGETAPATGFLSDLGGGGVRLSTAEDLPLGSVLLLRFRMPSLEREVVARGRIVLSFFNAEDRRFLHGVAFTQIDPRDQEAIVAYVTAEIARIAAAGDDASS